MDPTPPATTGISDIHDIYGPLPVATILPYMEIAAIVLLAAALLYVIFRLWRRRGRKMPPPKTPEQVALEGLEAARRLMKKEHSREFSFALSEVLRRYLESRFGSSAVSETTEEFLARLSTEEDSLLRAHRPMLALFLSRCDAAKFAGLSYDAELLDELFKSAHDFIGSCAGQFAAPAEAKEECK